MVITMGRLASKVALITGANSGIGRVSAELFAREGAAVVIVDLMKEGFNKVADGIVKTGGRAIAVPGDVSLLHDCVNAFEQTIKVFGKIDILVNNAGIGDFCTQTLKVTDEFWQKSIAVNQTGPFYFCREALKCFVPQEYGTIVNVASIAGVRGNAGLPYSATKHALVGMTKNIAIQYAGTDIRCNAVCPGATLTNMMNDDVLNKMDQEMWGVVEKHQCVDIPPMDPIHQANAILFFASDDSYGLTGQVVVVDRGKFL
jgi:NAD(P)-dependent dehydrogenase (short-subunit alcohol dehydrogenase family)